MPIIRRLAALAGYGTLAGTGGWLWFTRKCAFGPMDPNDYLFQSTIMARLNPDGHPGMSDQCIREVPLSKIKPELLKENGKLIEQFTASVWGGIGEACFFLRNASTTNTNDTGFAGQRVLLKRGNYNEKTAHHLWSQEELASSKYEQGTEMADHFEVMSKSQDSIIVRCGGSPLNKDVRSSDGLFELRAEIDEAEKVARFEMKSVFFNGLDKSEQHMVPQHIVFLHKLYTKWWMETALRNLTV